MQTYQKWQEETKKAERLERMLLRNERVACGIDCPLEKAVVVEPKWSNAANKF